MDIVYKTAQKTENSKEIQFILYTKIVPQMILNLTNLTLPELNLVLP